MFIIQQVVVVVTPLPWDMLWYDNVCMCEYMDLTADYTSNANRQIEYPELTSCMALSESIVSLV